MNVLAQLRASLASPAPQHVAPQPATPCPFTFGDWQPRTDAHATPGEAQRTISCQDRLQGWWRAQYVVPQLLDDQERLSGLLEPFWCHSVVSPDGSQLLLASRHAQAMLELFAERVQ